MIIGRHVGMCLIFSFSALAIAQQRIPQGVVDALNLPAVVASPLQFNGMSADGVMTELSFDPEAYAQLKAQTHALLTDFPLGSTTDTVTLEVKPFDVYTSDARIVMGTAQGDVPIARPDVLTLQGRVYGDDDSFVYLGISPTVVAGFVEYGGTRHIISSGPYGSGAKTVIYDLAKVPDGALQWEAFVCQAIEVGNSADSLGAEHYTTGDRGLVGQCYRATVAVDTDYEYTANLFGGDAVASNAYMPVLFGAVASIYRRDILVTLDLSYTRVWPENNDPYTGADQLGEFRDWWNANETGVARDTAHYLSGMGGGGVAYLSVICTGPYNYGQSNINGFFPQPVGSYKGGNWDLLVVSHEIGHNFSAPHTHDMTPQVDGCGTGDCTLAKGGTIMSYCHICPGGMTNIDLRFHERSINEFMRPFTLSRNCLEPYGPEVTQQPTAQTLCSGDSLLLLTATSDLAPTYQWSKNGVALQDSAHIQGATSRALYIGAVDLSDAGDYRCEVGDSVSGCTTKSNISTVMVSASGTITSQPASQTVTAGQTVFLSVSTSEPAFTFSYQWSRDGVPLNDGGHIGGSHSPLLVITNVQAADMGSYQCTLTNVFSFCEKTTNPAALTVTGGGCAGDVNGDSVVDLSDLGALLANFGVTSGATRGQGDLDGDGDVDLSDLGTLLAAYGAPC